MPKNNTKNNTILVLEDEDELLADLFDQLESETSSEFDVLGASQPRDANSVVPRRRVHTRRHKSAAEFEKVFESMVSHGTHFPVFIGDLRMEGDDGQMDSERGLHTALRVRSLDPRINIVIVTARVDVDASELCSKIGGKTYFMKRPYNPAAFVDLVVRLVDDWNEGR